MAEKYKSKKSFSEKAGKKTDRQDKPKKKFSRSKDENGEKSSRRSGNDSHKYDRSKKFKSEGFDKPKSFSRNKPQNKKTSDSQAKERETYTAGNNEEIRLNRYLANAGICSRREADDLIQAGEVTINDIVADQLGTKVKPGDIVKFNNQVVQLEQKVYILLNKPKDFITTMDDELGRRSVMELIRGACNERVFPVGRLDRITTGVLLLTNDGDLARKLTHPKFNKKKIYHVHLDKNIKGEDFTQILQGIELEDGFINADELEYVDSKDKRQIGIEIHSGRNRIVRRIFEHFGYKVIRLDRVYFAGLTKKGLPRGKWRFLSEKEVAMIKMGAFD